MTKIPNILIIFLIGVSIYVKPNKYLRKNKKSSLISLKAQYYSFVLINLTFVAYFCLDSTSLLSSGIPKALIKGSPM